ncbi:unnamed protein product [Mesocestoides corti]|uniref:Sugar phosphate transporter domain-containing protein n=1 Tax=Mesocestoides corti TaxID=53468 RepID=A0A0R3UPR5_MESCO|nr:unnamed protein product [Mesocestoides corti]
MAVFVSGLWPSAIHGLASAFLLFVHRSIFWNINVLFDGPLWITFVECVFTVIVCFIRLRSSHFSIIQCLKQGISAGVKEHSLVFIYCHRKSSASVVALLGALLVVVGYVVTLIEENLTNLLIAEGLVFGIFAALFAVMYYQEASRLAPGANYEVHLKQVYLNNVVCSFLTFVAIIFTETSEIMFLPFSPYLETLVFWLLVSLSCIASSIVGTVVLREVTTYSTSRRELIGLARSLLQTILSVIIFRVYTTAFWWVGVLLTATGTAIYWKAHMTNVTETSTPTDASTKDSLPLVANLVD